MSSFGAGYGSGSNSFSPIVKPKLTIATPATQRQRGDSSRPFGKTNATASGQAKRMVARLPPRSGTPTPRRRAAPTRFGGLGGRLRPRGSTRCGCVGAGGRSGGRRRQGTGSRGRGTDRSRAESSPLERSGRTSRTCSRPTVSAVSVASATPHARARSPRIPASFASPRRTAIGPPPRCVSVRPLAQARSLSFASTARARRTARSGLSSSAGAGPAAPGSCRPCPS